MQEVEVIIGADGVIKVQVRGLKGASCETITAGMEKLLGGELLDRQLTDEYHQPQELTQDESVRQRNQLGKG